MDCWAKFSILAHLPSTSKKKKLIGNVETNEGIHKHFTQTNWCPKTKSV